MKWLIGIGLVMLVAHLYFRRGRKRLEHQRPASQTTAPEDDLPNAP